MVPAKQQCDRARTPSRFLLFPSCFLPSFLSFFFFLPHVLSVSVTAISSSFYCATTPSWWWWTVTPIQVLLLTRHREEKKEKWERCGNTHTHTHTSGRDSLGLVLCVAAPLLPLTSDLWPPQPLSPPWFFFPVYWAVLLFYIKGNATEYLYWNREVFFFAQTPLLVQYSYPKFIWVFLSS